MARVHINSATFEELLSIPGVGAKIAAKIWELREDKGILELEDLREVPYMRITEAALESMDFSTSLPPNRGSNKFCKEEMGHQEKVQRIDSLIQARGRGQTEYPSQEKRPEPGSQCPHLHPSISTSKMVGNLTGGSGKTWEPTRTNGTGPWVLMGVQEITGMKGKHLGLDITMPGIQEGEEGVFKTSILIMRVQGSEMPSRRARLQHQGTPVAWGTPQGQGNPDGDMGTREALVGMHMTNRGTWEGQITKDRGGLWGLDLPSYKRA